ncbi:hypothetical protein K9M79_00750 [Candidatus Woesearchaeota archaeon]|nr:hypothetical protein [Candidatus Woesearchaeota archaeon]
MRSTVVRIVFIIFVAVLLGTLTSANSDSIAYSLQTNAEIIPNPSNQLSNISLSPQTSVSMPIIGTEIIFDGFTPDQITPSMGEPQTTDYLTLYSEKFNTTISKLNLSGLEKIRFVNVSDNYFGKYEKQDDLDIITLNPRKMTFTELMLVFIHEYAHFKYHNNDDTNPCTTMDCEEEYARDFVRANMISILT